jgi:hypothetical protein
MHISNGHVPADEERLDVYIIDDAFSFTSWLHIGRYQGGNGRRILTTAFPRQG